MTREKEVISFDDYHDRGMKKWTGFYLSEHTAMIEQLQQTERSFAAQKPQLSAVEISSVLQEAMVKNKAVAIQKEEVNQTGHYEPDIVGTIQGHDELGIFVADNKIGYDEIRHITFYDWKKWSDR